MRPRALFANARQAAVTINNDKLFTKNADDPRRYLTIRNAIPPECWADIEYMRVFLGELDIPAESFPGDLIAPEIAGKPVIDRIGKVSYSSKFFPPEKASVFAKINTVSSAADLDPEVVSAVKRDPDMIRMFPLRLQMDPAIMARLVRECPQLVSEHLISSELLRDATILRAYYATAEAKTNHGVYFDYQHHSLETLRDLAEQYGIAVTADAGFLSVIEDRMSQSTPDAPAWKRFYQEIYSAEHGVVSEMVAIKAQYRASAPVSAGLDTGGPRSHDWLRRLLESPDRGRTLVLSDTQRRLLLDHAPQIQDMFAQLGTIEMGPEDIRRFLGVFGPDIRKNPKLAAALREAIVALGKSFVRDRESANNELHAKGMNSPARDQLREAARHLGIAVPEADDPRSIALLRAMIVERIKQNAHDQLAAALKKLKHADLPLIRRLFGQELEVVIAGITGLGANEREALRRDILSRFEADASLALMNSPVGDAAIMGVSDREFEAAVRQTETQIAAAYASGCFGDALVDRVASRSGVSLQITASQAGNQSNAGATARDLGLQAGADGRLIVDTPTASTPCYIDPDR
ncbi:MAG TPA: hypothetical protein PK765_00055 [bacterium]|nr:hypothetical protein [bacterium]